MDQTKAISFELDAEDMTARAITAVKVMFAVLGVLALGIGVALLVWPGKTLAVGAAFAGVYFLMAGVVRIAMGIFGSAVSAGLRVLGIVLGLLMLAAGVVVLRNLEASAAVLLLILAIAMGLGWIMDGIMAIVESGKARSRGWAIAYGVVALVAGILVLVYPGITAAVIVWINAIVFTILGIVGIVRAFTFGRGVTAGS